MNIQRRRDGFITIADDDGTVLQFDEVPQQWIVAAENGIAVFNQECSFSSDRVLVMVPGTDAILAPYDEAKFVAPETPAPFVRVIILPLEVYQHGQIPDPDIPGSAEPFRPSSDTWEAVPKAARTSGDPHVQTIPFKGMRFARLTLNGLAAKKAVEAAAATEAARRLADEAKREEEEEKVRAKANEEARIEREKAHFRKLQQNFAAWFHGQPKPFLPGAKVLDMREATPRLAEVRYMGVTPCGDGTYQLSDEFHAKPPNHFTIVYNAEPRHSNIDTEFAWHEWGYWDQQIVYPPHVPEGFLTYEGQERPLGSRIPRDEALAGRDDPCPPQHGNLEFYQIEVIGGEFNGRFGDNLTVADALEILRTDMPTRIHHVRYDQRTDSDGDPYAAEDRDDGGWDQEIDLHRDYPQLFIRGEPHGQWLDRCFEDFPLWRSEHRKWLKKISETRERRCLEWQKRKPLFKALARFLNAKPVTFNRDGVVQIDDTDTPCFDSEAIVFELAIEGSQLDILVHRLRNMDCNVLVLNDRVEDRDILASSHTAAVGDQWAEVLSALKRCKGDANLFHSYTILLKAAERPPCILDGVIQRGTVCLLAGPSKVGKSTVAYEFAACVAGGQDFAGLKTQQGRAVYCSGEDTLETIAGRHQAAFGALGNIGIHDLLPLDASQFKRNLPGLLEYIRATLGRVDLIFIDPISSFVTDTSATGTARETMNILRDVAGEMDGAMVPIHHAGKKTTASNAKKASGVFENIKGSAEFVFAARQVVTLHAGSDGTRHLTLVADNMLIGTPKLQNSLVLKFNPRTGLHENLEEPVINSGLDDGLVPTSLTERASGRTKQKVAKELDADAHEIATVIVRIQSDGKGMARIHGENAPFKQRRKDELVGWTRSRCEDAHKRAIELGLLTGR